LTLSGVAVGETAAADDFTFRNGITFHATQEDIMTLESLPFYGQNSSDDPPSIRFGGKIAGIDNSTITYYFDPSTKELCDVMFSFDDAGNNDPHTLNSYYEDILASVSQQYGEPLSQSDTGARSVVGKAHEYHQETTMHLSSLLGIKDTVINDEAWVLEYDGYNVKIDLFAYYYMRGSKITSYSLEMGYRRYNAESTAAEPSTIDSGL
ncbi:MAG: hypothetical protein RR816_09675, partial [Clostridia bacterium]